MSSYVRTQEGMMNTDESDQKAAIYFINDMIWQIQAAEKAGGFESRDVVGMMWKWMKIGCLLHKPQYARENFLMFIRKADDPPAGKKASQILRSKLGRRADYPTYSAADLHLIIFKECEKAMATFIDQYRKIMKTRDPATYEYFIGYVKRMAALGSV
ncbi:MAG: hypothetical protein JST65_18165 [Acidobacteria bacterium]|nr:hypothetical protein [Acidobacteriota bacterium]